MAEHTPGPWRVIIDDDGNPLSGRPSVVAADEYDCGIVHWDGFVQTYWRSARGDKEIHANARLIAAAPELLESLRKARDLINDQEPLEALWYVKVANALAIIDAAIAKATTTQIAEQGDSHD